MNIKIYTDGSCIGNPGAGGYAAIILYEDGRREEIIGGESFTTNNRMELMAAIIALRKISPHDNAELFTDSTYLKNAFTQNWLDNWKKNGWKSSKKGAVKNQDLWKELDFLISHLNVTFHWVKGHAGNSLNERCDKLARETANKINAQSARSENFNTPTENVKPQSENVSTDENGRTWSGSQLLLFDE
ncbi:MAG: ribonuclease HI [Selenomonadaceae bacterium]|nr:ribonuclease HI [Selenomonadaceae bacterium]